MKTLYKSAAQIIKPFRWYFLRMDSNQTGKVVTLLFYFHALPLLATFFYMENGYKGGEYLHGVLLFLNLIIIGSWVIRYVDRTASVYKRYKKIDKRVAHVEEYATSLQTRIDRLNKILEERN